MVQQNLHSPIMPNFQVVLTFLSPSLRHGPAVQAVSLENLPAPRHSLNDFRSWIGAAYLGIMSSMDLKLFC